MWKHYLWIVPAMFALLWATKFIPIPTYPDPRLAETVASEFHGTVNVIDQGRGLKIGLIGDSSLHLVSGACNDTLCLGDVIGFGDYLWKEKDSIIIHLKRKATGEESLWYMKDYLK